ncbi:hypothetical protein VSS74_21680 [Conexibacter stalactiti]|uniref:Uncharacterized protein n=1 Tax=Conexibacter stalactiti TaxID=1940611 RepID=A0ABU4HUI1_9ACTN|nr:hypothetical protein [Conexibacter stalactiti]MDW5596973.1 hypothetical protein [Conexibacter stalactiti]MEC5037615.1 hypothetical protein [Conexibacter stalactiti]
MSRLRRLLDGALSLAESAAARLDASDLDKLTPAERERYEQWEARAAAVAAGAREDELEDPRLVGAVLLGPAGEAMRGISKPPRVPEPIEDPAAWEQRMLEERAVRDAARAQYLAPERRPVRISRVATGDGRGRLRELSDHLAATGLAGRPDLVYGISRVPDAISPARIGGAGIAEWDLVHAATAPLPPAAAPALCSLDPSERLVVRAPGERAPLDEDLALDLLARAGSGPERTLGIVRDLAIDRRDGDDGDGEPRIVMRVSGLHVLVGAGGAASSGAAPDLLAAAGPPPWWLPEGPPEGVVVELLQWDAIAAAIQPVRQRRPPLPSPFPYLPLTPRELLRAYLEIVGVDPADAYAAQVTHDRPFDLMGRTSTKRGVRRTGGGPDLPCADGKARKRMAGGHHVVIAYRDRPAYADGRDRFDSYAERELKARLRSGLGLRRPVPKQQHRLLRTAEKIADVIEVVTGDGGTEDGFTPPRYCWPPGR